MTEEQLKQCHVCKLFKRSTYFSRDARSPDGRQKRCKDCYRNYYDMNAEIIRQRSRDWSKEHSPKVDPRVRASNKAYYEANKIHLMERQKEYYSDPVNYAKRQFLLRRAHLKRFGMTQDDFDGLLLSQQSRCAICRSAEPGGMGIWHIDHDHACCPGKGSCGACVRGLLCMKCNHGLGAFDDDLAVIHKAMVYLSRRSRSLIEVVQA